MQDLTAARILKDIKIVIIDNPYKQIGNPEVKDLFGELVSLRAEGYGPEYSPNYLPLDSADFVVPQYLFCVDGDNGLYPIGGYRIISLNRCRDYLIHPPFLRTVEDSASQPHLDAVHAIIGQHSGPNQNLGYGGGFTIRKHFRQYPELSELMKELLVAQLVDDMEQHVFSGMLTGGIIRFKTDQFFQKAGFERLRWNSQSLEPIQKKSAFGEPVLLLELKTPSSWALECRRKHQDRLNKRVMFLADPASSLWKTAA